MSNVKYFEEKLESGELSLITLSEGAVIEMFDEALQKALENIVDINTALKPARQITLKVKLVPSTDRTLIAYDVDVSTKLAGMEPVTGTADLTIDAGGKGVIAKQRGQHQIPLFGNMIQMTHKEK